MTIEPSAPITAGHAGGGPRRRGEGTGLAYGAAAYIIWGMFPAFFGLLDFAGPLQVLAHRVVWTLVLMAVVMIAGRHLGSLRGLTLRTWLLLVAGAVSISINWGIYIYAVLSGHVAEAALGYFINPLVSVLIGVVFFREHLSLVAGAALVLAALAVGVLTVAYRQPPTIALTLAGSFALYGVVKKLVPVSPRISLSAETLILAPLALGYLAVLILSQHHGHIPWTPAQLALLILSGPMTAAPLLLFGAAAHRLPVITLGLLQYITPILQLLWAVVARHENLTAATWLGFALVWCALMMFTTGSLQRLRRHRNPSDRGSTIPRV